MRLGFGVGCWIGFRHRFLLEGFRLRVAFALCADLVMMLWLSSWGLTFFLGCWLRRGADVSSFD